MQRDLRAAVMRLAELLPGAPSEFVFRHGRRAVEDVRAVEGALDRILLGAVASIQALDGRGDKREPAATVAARVVEVEMLVELLAEATDRARVTRDQLQAATPTASRVFGAGPAGGTFH